MGILHDDEEDLRAEIGNLRRDVERLTAELELSQSTSAALLVSVKNWERQCNDKCDAMERLTAERDEALERVKAVELRSAATPVDVAKSDDLDYLLTRSEEIADQIRSGTFKLDVRQNDDGTFSLHEERIDSISGLLFAQRYWVGNARDNFNACARLEAQVRDLTAERDAALWYAEELRQTKERLADCERTRDQWHDAAHRLADERDTAHKKLKAVRLNCDAVVEGLRHFDEIDGEAMGMSKVAKMVLDLIGGPNE